MPRKQLLSLRCPSCKKLVLRTDPEFPFCSERCRVIDLGRWASGGYVISTPITNPDDMGFTSDPRTDRSAGVSPAPRENSDSTGTRSPSRRKPQ